MLMCAIRYDKIFIWLFVSQKLGATKTVSGLPPDWRIIMSNEEIGILIAFSTLLFTIIGTYIDYKGYSTRKRGKPKGTKDKERHDKSNRKSLAKISVAFIIKVTRK